MRKLGILSIVLVSLLFVGFSRPLGMDEDAYQWDMSSDTMIMPEENETWTTEPQGPEMGGQQLDVITSPVDTPGMYGPMGPGEPEFSEIEEMIKKEMEEHIASQVEARLRFSEEVKNRCKSVAEELRKAVLEGDEEKMFRLREELANCSSEQMMRMCKEISAELQELEKKSEQCLVSPYADPSECEEINKRIRRLDVQRQLCEYQNYGIIDCEMLEERLNSLRSAFMDCIGSNTTDCLSVRFEFADAMGQYARACKPDVARMKELVNCETEKRILERVRERLEEMLRFKNESKVQKKIQERIGQLEQVIARLNDTCKKYPNPCLIAEKLERAYSILVNESNASDVAVFEVGSRLELLKRLCVEENISLEDVGSLEEAQNILEKKLEAVTSLGNASEMIQALRKVKAEKGNLLREYIKERKRLNLTEQKLVRRLVVTEGNLIADNESLPPAEVIARVKNRLIRILPEGDKVVLQDVVNVTADELIYENGVLKTPMGKEIRVLPSEILSKVKREQDEIKEIKLENQFNPRYRAKVVEKRKLLGLIPWDLEVDKVVDAQTGKLLEENRPWWSFLLF